MIVAFNAVAVQYSSVMCADTKQGNQNSIRLKPPLNKEKGV